MAPGLLTVIQLKPLSCATAKRVSVAVAQLELDVFVIGFNGSRTNAEFLRDPAGSETGTAERKDMQFAVGQVRYLRMWCRAVDDFVNGAQCDSWTDIKLTCENIFNGTDQLFPRTGFHPVP